MMGCAYCNGSLRIYDSSSGDNYAWVSESGYMYVELDGGNELEFAVDYCPKCGRKLGDTNV